MCLISSTSLKTRMISPTLPFPVGLYACRMTNVAIAPSAQAPLTTARDLVAGYLRFERGESRECKDRYAHAVVSKALSAYDYALVKKVCLHVAAYDATRSTLEGYRYRGVEAREMGSKSENFTNEAMLGVFTAFTLRDFHSRIERERDRQPFGR